MDFTCFKINFDMNERYAVTRLIIWSGESGKITAIERNEPRGKSWSQCPFKVKLAVKITFSSVLESPSTPLDIITNEANLR